MAFDAADLAAFNDEDMPGHALATFSWGQVAGRFRRNYAAALGIGGNKPVFTATTDNLASVQRDEAVAINGSTYRVTEIHTAVDGLPNHTRLMLKVA